MDEQADFSEYFQPRSSSSLLEIELLVGEQEENLLLVSSRRLKLDLVLHM